MINRPVATLIRKQILLTAPPDTSVHEACRRMAERRVGSVLVTDERGRLLGIFTERDAVCRVLARARDADRTTLAAVMTEKVSIIPPRGSALEALRLMQDGGFRHVPVVDGERVVGIVSWTDFRGPEHARLEEETQLWETAR